MHTVDDPVTRRAFLTIGGLGAIGLGLPALWLAFCLLVIPIGVYVASYLPWAQVDNHQLVEGWPPGHTGETLLDRTGSMYRYHNDLYSAHPASSPWWWPGCCWATAPR